MVYRGKELNHPFGISHHHNFIFWTEYMNASVFQLDLSTGEVTLLRSERPPLFGLRVYDAQSQQGWLLSLHLVHTQCRWIVDCFLNRECGWLALKIGPLCVPTAFMGINFIWYIHQSYVNACWISFSWCTWAATGMTSKSPQVPVLFPVYHVSSCKSSLSCWEPISWNLPIKCAGFTLWIHTYKQHTVCVCLPVSSIS